MAGHPPSFYAKVAGACFVVRAVGVWRERGREGGSAFALFDPPPRLLLSSNASLPLFSLLPQAGGAMEAFMIKTGFYDKCERPGEEREERGAPPGPRTSHHLSSIHPMSPFHASTKHTTQGHRHRGGAAGGDPGGAGPLPDGPAGGGGAAGKGQGRGRASAAGDGGRVAMMGMDESL